MISFKQYYLTEMQNLAGKELYKYDWRVELFLKKLTKGEPFELVDGKKVVFIKSKDVIDAIKNHKPTTGLKLHDKDGNIYTFTNIAKNAEFGGGGGQGAGSDVTRTTESAQAVYAAAKWNRSKEYSPADLKMAYKGSDVDEPLEGVLNKLTPEWRDSCIIGAEALYKKYGKKNYTFHRGSTWVDALEKLFKRLNANDKAFSNINKWSQADIYMISPTGLAIKLDAAKNIVELNGMLLAALRKGDIIGVSLKLLKNAAKISEYNTGSDKHIIEFNKYTTGTKGFFGGKDVYIYFTQDGKIQFRTFPETFQGEIKGKNANQGKLSYGPIQTILRQLKIPQLMDIKVLRSALEKKDAKVYAAFYKNYSRYAMDSSKLSLSAFIAECDAKGVSWSFSKFLGCQLIDIIKTNRKEDEFITACIQYASSSSDLSAPFIKME